MPFVDHPIILTILAAVIGFVSKFLWDRWFSQSSRVTKEECKLMRTGCTAIREFNKAEFMRLFGEIEAKRRAQEEEDEEYCAHRRVTRGHTIKMLRVIMMTQLQICNHLKLDCSEIGKALVEMGEVD